MRCQGLIEGGLTVEEVMEKRAEEETRLTENLYNDELGGQQFQARGVGGVRKIRDQVQKIKERITRTRKRLFDAPDKKEEAK